MEKVEEAPNDPESEETEAIELILFQVSECYVYLIPPRKSAASYRADEWDVNKGEECIIRLEDKITGELYALAFLRKGELHPVEPVIDSSSYLDKKKTAEEMEQHFQNTSSVDYSIKEGETLVLQMKNKPGGSVKSKIFEQGLNNLSLEGNSDGKESFLSISLPPPPPAPLSPAMSVQNSPSNLPPKITLDGNSTEKSPNLTKDEAEHQHFPDNESSQDTQDDDFGDFQAAG